MPPKSLLLRDFYGTGIEIWVGFGPVGITENKWADDEHMFQNSFMYFKGNFTCTLL